jgi:chromosome partitioning protein
MRTTTIINGKGGVGKTTTAHAMATGLNKTVVWNGKVRTDEDGNQAKLYEMGEDINRYKTLAVDYDPQGNLSFAFGADVLNSPTMYHIINGDISIHEAIQHTPQGDLIVGNASLTKIESMFSGDDIFEGLEKLREQLALVSEAYTHVFIDNQPLIGGMLTRQTLIAADDLVVPMAADMFTIQGLARLEKAVESIIKRDNPRLRIAGLLLTKHNSRTIFGSDVSHAIAKWAAEHQTIVFDSFIRESVAVKESQAKKKSLYDYAPKSNPAIDYLLFIQEYLKKGEA